MLRVSPVSLNGNFSFIRRLMAAAETESTDIAHDQRMSHHHIVENDSTQQIKKHIELTLNNWQEIKHVHATTQVCMQIGP